jgi:hypothetical protein
VPRVLRTFCEPPGLLLLLDLRGSGAILREDTFEEPDCGDDIIVGNGSRNKEFALIEEYDRWF